MTRHIGLGVYVDVQSLCMHDHILDVQGSIIFRGVTFLYAHICQATIYRPMKGEALCIVYVPMKDIEVVFIEHGQKINYGLDRKELPACVQHESSVWV